MRFHVVGLPHTTTSREFCACAYTTKVFNFCKMMHTRGHTVIHYGVEGSNPPCNEHVQLLSKQEQISFFGQTNKQQPYDLDWNPDAVHWKIYNKRALDSINKNLKQGDFVCLIAGWSHKDLIDNMLVPCVEFGVGYYGTHSKFRIFESYAHMAACYGKDANGSPLDAVIPNSYDPADFPLGQGKGNYFAYLGRFIERKGLSTAVDICGRIGARLVFAGQGTPPPGSECIGHLNMEEKAKFLGNATALFVPTIYVEAFGGVAVEAQMTGTPVLTTDWGAFPETVEHGITGYRCRSIDHWVWATKNVHKLDRRMIRQRAVNRFSLGRAAMMYEEYFDMLSKWGRISNREQLDWLKPR